MKKAKFIRAYTDDYDHRRYGEYKYRNRRYDVCFEWNAEPLSWQHKCWQNLIDRQLDTVCKATEDAQVGFDLFWEYVNSENPRPEDFGQKRR